MKLSRDAAGRAAIVLGGALLVGSVAMALVPPALDGPGCSAEFVMFGPVDAADITMRDQFSLLPFGVACVIEREAVEGGRVYPSPVWSVGIGIGGALALVGAGMLRPAARRPL